MAEPHAGAPLDPRSGRESGADASTIDWEHLSRQTFGDDALERELLDLFLRQAEEFRARLAGPAPSDGGKARRDLAHTLKGSARAIGAFALADAAERYESSLAADGDASAETRRALGASLEAARSAIAERLGRG